MFKEKTCIICGEVFIPNSGAAKACSKTCHLENIKRHNHARHIATYVRKGYTQRREQNNSWRGGTGVFRDMAFIDYGMAKICNRCKAPANLVHHINRNRRDNSRENLEILCKACHQHEHCIRDSKGRFAKHVKG